MYIRSVANSGKCLSVTFDDVRFMVFPDRSLNVRDCLLTADIFIPESKGGGGYTRMIHCGWFLFLSRMNISAQ